MLQVMRNEPNTLKKALKAAMVHVGTIREVINVILFGLCMY